MGMNRTIKFRAWKPSKRKMIQHHRFILVDNVSDDDFIIEQFTGLHDKNGKEIYAGDLLRFYIQISVATPYNPSELVQVEFKNGCYGFKHIFPELCHEDDREWCSFWREDSKDMWDSNYFTILGNIHENPELLNA